MMRFILQETKSHILMNKSYLQNNPFRWSGNQKRRNDAYAVLPQRRQMQTIFLLLLLLSATTSVEELRSRRPILRARRVEFCHREDTRQSGCGPEAPTPERRQHKPTAANLRCVVSAAITSWLGVTWFCDIMSDMLGATNPRNTPADHFKWIWWTSNQVQVF